MPAKAEARFWLGERRMEVSVNFSAFDEATQVAIATGALRELLVVRDRQLRAESIRQIRLIIWQADRILRAKKGKE